MQQRLLILGLVLTILGFTACVATTGIVLILDAQSAAIDRAQEALLQNPVEGGRLVKDSDGSIWAETRFRHSQGTGTQRIWISDLSAKSQEFEQQRSNLKTHQLFWRPLRRLGAAPLALGLVIFVPCYLIRRTATGQPSDTDDSIVLTPILMHVPRR